MGLRTVKFEEDDERIRKLGMIYFTCGDWEPLVTEGEEPTPEEPDDEGIPVTDSTTDPSEADKEPSDGAETGQEEDTSTTPVDDGNSQTPEDPVDNTPDNGNDSATGETN